MRKTERKRQYCLIPTKTNLVGFLFLEGEDFPNRFCLKKVDFNDNLDLWE